MPTIVENLEEIIAKEFHHPPNNDHLTLSEEGQETCSIWVGGLSLFAMNIDLKRKKGQGDRVFPFLNAKIAGLTKKCDMILFVPQAERKLLVFLFEMKEHNNSQYLLQLRASREFVRFLVSLLELHREAQVEPKIADLQIEFRGVLIKWQKQPAKGTSRAKSQPLEFKGRNGLEVCECDRATPPRLSTLIKAAR